MLKTTRRKFLKNSALVAASASMSQTFINEAMAADPLKIWTIGVAKVTKTWDEMGKQDGVPLVYSFLPLGVFSSALSPMAMGMLIDAGYGMTTLMGMNIMLAVLAQAMGAVMLMRPPPGLRSLSCVAFGLA